MQKPTAAIITIITILSRLLPHPPNFTTLGSSALFAGGKVGRPWNYLLPFVALTLTDLIIGLHGTMPYVYGSVVVMIWLGERFLTNKPATSRLLTVALAGSTVFFLVTNFGVWASTAMYPKTAAGLVESYLMGLPFWRNMLAGDIIFTVGFFRLYQLAEQKHVITIVDQKIRRLITG
ncbi:MAG: DUF6580 family putative transport protein [Patescibacteria group bacterium]